MLLKGVNDDVGVMRALVHGLLRMRVRPYYVFQCQLLAGTAHLRTSIERGLEVMQGLRGHLTGFGVPTYVLDTPYGKVPLAPQYLLGRAGDEVVVRTWDGHLWREPNPLDGQHARHVSLPAVRWRRVLRGRRSATPVPRRRGGRVGRGGPIGTVMGSTFGHLFRITTWGESHGPAVGVVVDGCPPGVPLDETDLQAELDRRRPGQSRITTQRAEADRAEILSGVFEGCTTGTAIHVLVRNQDARSRDYDEMRTAFRPSHADYTYSAKYGRRDWRGGGRASARETVGRVAAGAIAAKVLRLSCGAEVVSYVKQVSDVEADGGFGQRHAAPRWRRTSPAAPIRPRLQRCRNASSGRARRATRSAAWWRRWHAACRPASASRCSTSSTPTWRRRCCRCPPAAGSRSAPASPARA